MIYVWRKADEKDGPHLVPKKSRSGIINVMMWGCIMTKEASIYQLMAP